MKIHWFTVLGLAVSVVLLIGWSKTLPVLARVTSVMPDNISRQALRIGALQSSSMDLTLDALQKNSGGFSSRYIITNTVNVPAYTVHQFYDNGGVPVTSILSVIPANSSQVYDLAVITELYDGYRGYVVIQSDQEITGTVLGPSYTISGRVTDNGGNPIAGVTVSAGGGGSATTDSNGDYSLGGLVGGSYTVTPSASNYTFTPTSRTISVPPNATGINFVLNGDPGACVPDNQRIGISSVNVCVVVTPFLEIPFPYTYTTFGTVVQGSNYTFATGKGRINSWFDHKYPTYTCPPNGQYDQNGNCSGGNGNLYRWDGEDFYFNQTPSVQGVSWYDGHAGLDFSRRYDDSQQSESIWAAAAGRVVYAKDGCPDVKGKPEGHPDRKCGNYLGNQVWVDHGNGYATVYGHLALHSIPVTLTLTSGTPVAEKTFLGLMGNTGNSDGKHLHFGLYYDTSGNRTWVSVTGQILPTTITVDPFGFWKTSRAPEDPWASQRGINSVYLWKYPLMSMMPINSSGGNTASPSSLVNVSVPPLALASQYNLEVWDAPPATLPLAPQRSVGSSFWIRLWQAIAGSSVTNITAQTNAFAQPVTLNVNYGAEMVVKRQLEILSSDN